MSTQVPNQAVRLTKTLVDKLPSPASGQHFFRDADLKGFGIRITANGVKSFIIEKRINGRVRRQTIGRFGELTVEQARIHARQELGKIALGMDPIAERKKAKVRGVTLAEAYHEFKQVRQLKPSTQRDYEYLYKGIFADWHKKPLTEITKSMVSKRHQELGQERGEAQANIAMRFLRAVINFAIARYDDHKGQSIITENPVRVLSTTRAWFRPERRKTIIKPYQLKEWYQAIITLKESDREASPHMNNELVADYLLLMLLTGLRKTEAAKLRWSDVDFQHRTLTISDTKNHETHTLPLTDFLFDLLTTRKVSAVNDYIFPGKDGLSHLVEPKRQIQKVIEQSGVQFTLHDLRRTFATVAESLDISPYTVKRLLNHKMRNDVTAGYIISDIERLRGPMKTISDYLLTACNIQPTQSPE